MSLPNPLFLDGAVTRFELVCFGAGFAFLAGAILTWLHGGMPGV